MTNSRRFEGFRDGIVGAVMAADGVAWRGWIFGLDTFMLALREELPMQDDIARLEPRVARIEADVSQLNARAMAQADLNDFRFALVIALLSAAVTLAAVILVVLLSGPHAH